MHSRLLAVAFLATLLPATVAAQGSPLIPLDDARLPLAEHLIARGSVRDPSPFTRPFRRADLVAALREADTLPDSPDGRVIRALLDAWTDLPDEARWLAEGRAGAQAFSRTRRNLLRPEGGSGVQPYVDLRLEGVFGPIVAVSRPAVEPRLADDPDWRGRRDLRVVGRMAEAYLAAQTRYATVWFGQMDQQWGPQGTFGIPISAGVSYPRPYLGIEVGTRDLRLAGQVATLRDEVDEATGETVKRYHIMHRLQARLSDRLSLALWETTVYAGTDRSLEGRFINPLSLLLLANQYGEGDPGNVMLGVDARWRAARAVTLEAQVGLDDVQYNDTGFPNRWALGLAAFGPLGARLGWRAAYSATSSLALQATDPAENYVERGTGLGRPTPDTDLLTVQLTVPVRGRWLLTPEATVQRQGARRFDDPFPATGDEARPIGELLSGTVETTWRLALGVSGREGPLDLAGSAGLHHIRNVGHRVGDVQTRFEGRVQATLFFTRRGALR